jgi:hypothetical protein
LYNEPESDRKARKQNYDVKIPLMVGSQEHRFIPWNIIHSGNLKFYSGKKDHYFPPKVARFLSRLSFIFCEKRPNPPGIYACYQGYRGDKIQEQGMNYS